MEPILKRTLPKPALPKGSFKEPAVKNPYIFDELNL
jgi:hypothetical protein